MLKKLFKVVMAVVIAVTVGTSVAPAAVSQAASVQDSLDVQAKAAIAVDVQSGKILYAKNAQQVLPVASMSKLLTVYLFLDAIKSGRVKWTDEIKPDKTVAAISQSHELSNVPLVTDKAYQAREIYEATLIYSANAAAMMLGDIVTGGDQPKFIDMMNAQLRKWGIHDAKMVNANGLTNDALGDAIYPGSAKTAENVMSAKDMAIVARHLLQDFPEVLATTKLTKKTFQKGTRDATDMPNWNLMLPGMVAAQSDLVVDGLKTGTTDTAGDCFTGTAVKNGRRILTVVMNAGGEGETKRFVQTAALMRWSFANWKEMTVAKAGQALTNPATVAVDKGKELQVRVGAKSTVTTMVPKTVQAAAVKWQPQHVSKLMAAPVAKGTKAGIAQLNVPGDTLGYLQADAMTVPLVATQTVDKAGFFRLIGRGVKEFFTNLF